MHYSVFNFYGVHVYIRYPASEEHHAHVQKFNVIYIWVNYTMLRNIRANILFQLRRAHSSQHQVTLERSDFRTDFRTRLKNKQLSVDGSTKLILPCQGKQAWYIQLSSAIWKIYQNYCHAYESQELLRCQTQNKSLLETGNALHVTSIILYHIVSEYVSVCIQLQMLLIMDRH